MARPTGQLANRRLFRSISTDRLHESLKSLNSVNSRPSEPMAHLLPSASHTSPPPPSTLPHPPTKLSRSAARPPSSSGPSPSPLRPSLVRPISTWVRHNQLDPNSPAAARASYLSIPSLCRNSTRDAAPSGPISRPCPERRHHNTFLLADHSYFMVCHLLEISISISRTPSQSTILILPVLVPGKRRVFSRQHTLSTNLV